MRSALKAVTGVAAVQISAYANAYTLTFRAGVTPDEALVREVFKGCAHRGRRMEVVEDPQAPRPLPPAPEDNPTTEGRVALGRRLFADKRLSRDGTVSCATCHQARRAFTNGQVTAAGVGGRKMRRNVPTLLNVGYRKLLFWDGHARDLEEVTVKALEHPAIVDMTPDQFVARVRSIPEYDQAFRREFGGPATLEAASQALAAYQRALISDAVPFDRFARGDETALSQSARRGYLVFRDKANCVTCHSGPDFTDGAFRRIGIGWDGKVYKDPGRGKVIPKKGGPGMFRVPTLRELRWTAPYMHDGSLKTLEEVVDYYNQAGTKGAPSDLKKPLNLTDTEKKDLVAFLQSLSSTSSTAVAFESEANPRRDSPSKTEGSGAADAHGMVFLRGGEFVRQGRKVRVPSFYIDQYEVTNEQYCRFLNAKPEHADFWNESQEIHRVDGKFVAKEAKEKWPVYAVTWDEAATYARWAGKRLPTEAQWEYAAGGMHGTKYPWGNEPISAERANFGGNVGHPVPAGSYTAGKTPEGICDLAGNVAEWCADWYEGGYYTVAPEDDPAGPENGDRRVRRGGCYAMDALAQERSARGFSSPAYRPRCIGFRCVRCATD